jgi:hypothetical protein
MLMGITTILVVPSSRGKGFFEYLALLVFPAILAESRIGGSFRLIATIQSIGTHELAAGTVIIVGGYFYLRYATLTNLNHLELLDNGGGEEDVAEISWRSNIVAAITVLSASGLAALLLASTSSVSDAFRTTVGSFPLLSLTLALFAGLAVTIFLYTLQLTRKQENLQRTHVNRNRHAR